MPNAFCWLVKGRGAQPVRQDEIRQRRNERIVPDPFRFSAQDDPDRKNRDNPYPRYKTRHSELSLAYEDSWLSICNAWQAITAKPCVNAILPPKPLSFL